MKLKLIVNTLFILTLGHNAMAAVGFSGGSFSNACTQLDLTTLEKSASVGELTDYQAAILRAFKAKQPISRCFNQADLDSWSKLSIHEQIATLSTLFIQFPGSN